MEAVVLYDASGRPMQVTTARALDPPAFFQGEQRVGLATTGMSSQPSPDALLREYKSWHAIAARAKAQRLSSLNMEVTRDVMTEEGTKKEEVIDDHRLKLLLDKPNPLFTKRQTLLLFSNWLTQVGQAYLLKITDGLGNVREVWPLNPANVDIIVGEDRPIEGYVYHSQGGEDEYDFDEVIRVWDPDPASPFDGLGTLGPQALGYDTSKFMEETARQHFRDDAIPKVAMIAQDDRATLPVGEDRDVFDMDWRARYSRRFGTNRGLPAFIPEGFDLKEFGGLESFASFVEVLSYHRDKFFMANSVPRSVVGDVVDANRAAAETNFYVFDLIAVKPQGELIADSFTEQLAPDFEDGIRVRFEEFVSKDKEFILKQEAQDLTTKVRTINQVREDRGLAPADWGDEPVGTFGDTPYRPDEEPELEEDEPDALEVEEEEPEEEEEEERTWSPDTVRAFSPEAEWRRLLEREAEFGPLFARKIREVLARQKNALISELGTLDLRARHARDRLAELFASDRWSRVFNSAVGPVRRRIVQTTGQQTMTLLGSDSSFVFDDMVKRQLQAHGAEMVRQLNRTTMLRLRKALVEGVEAGEGERELAKRVRTVFAGRRSNARTIARTEVLTASSMATSAAYGQSGVARKRWNTAGDPKVRDAHEIHGQVVAVTDTFTLGDGERAEAPGVGPGGRALSARNRINCRCFLTPVLD